MKIIRVLFGSKLISGTNVEMRRHKIDSDIELNLKCSKFLPINHYTVFTFGFDNHKYLIDKGFNSILVDNKPYLYDIKLYCYMNKIRLLQYALNQFKEPILYLDMDTLAQRPINDLNDYFRPLGCISANLMIYTQIKCIWRDKDRRKLPNGGFLYVKDIDTINGIIDHWEFLKKSGYPSQNDEIAIMHYLDDKHGGFIGEQGWLNLYEPKNICSLTHKGIFPNPSALFLHFIQNSARIKDIYLRSL